MKSTFKKILAVALAVMMLAALSVTAFADAGAGTWTTEGTNGTSIWKNEQGITSIGVTVQIDTASQVPTTAFSYEIAAGTAVEPNTNAIKIYAGPTDGVKLPDTARVAFAANDDDKVETLTLTVDATKFNHAGIYRYVLTQKELTNEQKSIGLGSEGENGAAVAKYLDVYVENTTTSGTYKVTNIVLSNTKQEALNVTNSLVSYNDKTDRFVNTFGKTNTPDPEHPENPKSENYTVTITKNVTGASADKTFAFPFTVTLGYENPTNTTATDNDANTTTLVGMKVGVSSTGALPKVDSAYITDMTIGEKTSSTNGTAVAGFTLADGQSITLTNVPKDVLVSVQENVDAGEGYTITYTAENFADGNTTEDTAVSASTGTNTFADAGTVVTLKKVGAQNATITYTNNRDSISPTGVVLRVAPYALMLGVGLFLVLFSRKRRNAENEA